MSGMSLCPAFRHRLNPFEKSLARWWNLSWKIRANSAALLVSLPANAAMHVPWPRVWKLWRWGRSFSEQSCWWNSSALLAPCQRSYACPIALCLHTAWQVLGAHFFGAIQLMKFVLKTHSNSSRFSLYRYAAICSSPQAISHGFPSVHHVHASVSLPPNGCPRFCVAPPAAKQTKREPKHRRCFWKKEHHWPKNKSTDLPPKNSPWFAQPLSSFFLPCWDRKMRI